MSVYKIVLLVAVVMVVFAATFALQGRLQLPGFEPPSTNRDGSVDTTALAGWRPSGGIALIGRLSAPFAPHADFSRARVVVAPGTPVTLTAVPDGKDMVVGRFTATAGAALVRHACIGDRTCPQVLCVCAAGNALTQASAVCAGTPHWSQPAPPGVCRPGSEKGTFMLGDEARTIEVEALGDAPATLSLK